MADRQLKVTLVGDTRNLDRALGRAETRLTRFGRTAGRIGGVGGVSGAGALAGLSRGGAFAAVAGGSVLGLKSVTDAAENAQIILGQTSVAVKDAGLSWEQYGKQVQDASMAIAKSSAFDDEAVLQSFAVFVRGQKDVGKSLQLSQLAADVARGRYTDLASATQLVNKAALGQIGALRRAGIAIDKNATSTQALTALQAAYGGAAVRYANSAVGAQDKLRVSVENLRESIGGGLLPALTKAVNTLNAAAMAGGHVGDEFQSADKKTGGFLSEALKHVTQMSYYLNPGTGGILAGIHAINSALGDTASKLGDVASNAQAFSNSFGLGALTAAGNAQTKKNPFKVGKAAGPTTGVSAALQGAEVDARLSGNVSLLKGVLAKEAHALQTDIKNSLPEDQLPLKQALLGVTDEIKGIDAQIIADADAKKQAAKDAKEKLRAANKAALQALKDQANSLKSAALDALGLKQQGLDTSRGLSDAQAALRQALVLGGQDTIKGARRGLQDADIARQQFLLQQATVKPGANAAAGATITIGNVHISGVQNVPQLIEEIRRIEKRGAASTSGRYPGHGRM